MTPGGSRGNRAGAIASPAHHYWLREIHSAARARRMVDGAVMIAYEMKSVLEMSFSNTSDPVELVNWASVIAAGELRKQNRQWAG